MNWTRELLDQLSWHWSNQLRPRLEDLTDAEYFWEPVPGCWTLRRVDDGQYELDFSRPEPTPPPLTTIAWRLCHIIGPVFAARNATLFGAPSFDAETFAWPGTAANALDMLDGQYVTWRDGVEGLDEGDLEREVVQRFFTATTAALILHIHREVIHHGAEIALLRDLYRWRNGSGT